MSADRGERRVRVGLIGCGRIATRVHLPVLARLEACELTALAESDPARLAEARTQVPAARAYAGYDEMLREADLDAVVIALPTHLHAETAALAFAQGKHVYVEKPLAATSEEAEPAMRAWRAARTVGAVGYVFRFHPMVVALKEALAAERLGDVVAVRTSFGAEPRELPAWKQSRSTGGGALLDLASHHVDLIRFLFDDEVKEVSARVRSVRTEDDTALVELRLSGGIHAQVFTSSSAVQEDVVEVYGTAGKLVVDRFASRSLLATAPSRSFARSERIRRTAEHARRLYDVVSPPGEPSFAIALSSFVRAAGGAHYDGATLEDGYRALQVVEAAEESTRTGRWVPVRLDQRA